MQESEVEKQFVEAVRAVGGQALKFTSQTMNGVPDRLVLLLGGKCAFVELKAPGKQMRILQRKRRQQLEALGFPVFCVDRLEQIQPAVDALLHWTPGEPIPKGIGAKIPEMPVVELPDTAESRDSHSAHSGDSGEEVVPLGSSFHTIISVFAQSISRLIQSQPCFWIWAWVKARPSLHCQPSKI